jgi:hypothetical protein
VNGPGRRGINLVGLEGGYGTDDPGNAEEWQRSEGPRAGMDYPLHAPALIDYYFSRNIRIIRLLFSWERMQSQLWGSVPDPLPGYAQYFANFKQIVDYATSLGVTVIIEPWQAGLTAEPAGRYGEANSSGNRRIRWIGTRSPISGQRSQASSRATRWSSMGW